MVTGLAQATQLTDALHALADPNRLQIINLLSKRDHCVCHLVDSLNLKQSIVSHHIGVLRRANLVTNYHHPVDRRWLYYRLNRETLAQLTFELSGIADDSDYDPTPLPCPIDEILSES